MKVAVIIKQVPDAEARIRPAADGIDLSGVTYVLDGMDEYGVEQAVRMREGGLDAEIIALAIGPARYEDAIRTALALGADRAVFVATDQDLDALAQARVFARLVADEGIELVFAGGKQADWDSAALGPALAAVLGWSHVDWTTELELSGRTLALRHDTDDGSETLEVTLPAVITTQQGLNEPRYPTLPNIMKAKRKELARRELSEFADAAPRSEVVGQEIQSRERLGRMVQGEPGEAARELVRLLREEAKVI